MSVTTLINSLYDSELDFSNTNVDDFVYCVKKLARIIESASSDTRKSTRDRKMNSVLAHQVFLQNRFNPKTVHDYYSFTFENEQIDICIKSGSYCVSVCGDYIPTEDSLIHVLQLDNFNFPETFDFSVPNCFHFEDSKFTYFGGNDFFTLNEVGLKKIQRVWSTIVQMYLSHIQGRLNV